MMISGAGREFIIKDTHRGLYYEDGKLTKILEAGRYKIPPQKRWFNRLTTVECLLVDVRQRELTIKGQEILTADKVAIRVGILVQSCVSWRRTPTRDGTLVSTAMARLSTERKPSRPVRKTGEPTVNDNCQYSGTGDHYF